MSRWTAWAVCKLAWEGSFVGSYERRKHFWSVVWKRVTWIKLRIKLIAKKRGVEGDLVDLVLSLYQNALRTVQIHRSQMIEWIVELRIIWKRGEHLWRVTSLVNTVYLSEVELSIEILLEKELLNELEQYSSALFDVFGRHQSFLFANQFEKKKLPFSTAAYHNVISLLPKCALSSSVLARQPSSHYVVHALWLHWYTVHRWARSCQIFKSKRKPEIWGLRKLRACCHLFTFLTR